MVVIVGTSGERICIGNALLLLEACIVASEDSRLSDLVRDALSLLASELRERENIVTADVGAHDQPWLCYSPM